MEDRLRAELGKKSPDLVEKMNREYQEREGAYPSESWTDTQNFDLEKRKIDDRLKKETQESIGKILGRITDRMKLVSEFLEICPIHYDSALNWWMWDKRAYCWKMVDETDILIVINRASDSNLYNSTEKTEILNALRIKAREKTPIPLSQTMIQFDREIVDLTDGRRFIAKPDFFSVNPIPFRLGFRELTPKFDKLFSEWVAPDKVNNLYEIIAYCLLPDYPIERIPCLLGSGANGKSTFLKILYTFLGMNNICTTGLDVLLKSRFETGRMYKKLACIMAETNLSSIDNSQLIKKLVSGKDPIAIEFKHKGLTEFINYAKIIIATNNLPPTEDKTDGFYRRWLIIDFPNQFEKEVDVLKDITREDYESLATKCLFVLDDLLKRRAFSGEGNIADRRRVYEEKSNPFDKFWEECISDEDPNSDITVSSFTRELNIWMKEHKMRHLSDNAIGRLVKQKNINQVRLMKEWYEDGQSSNKLVRCWAGIKWKN